MDNSSVYLKVGDWVTISHDNLYLSIQSLTQSGVVMRDNLANLINSVFILSTPKYLEMSQKEGTDKEKFNQDGVYFGESLILIHLISGKYLSYSHELDNKSSMQLSSTFKNNCEFAIKPIFKCQTVVSRKIRNEEDIVICPAQMKNRQGNMALVLLKMENRTVNKSYVYMKKNEQTSFQFTRKNLLCRKQKNITNLQIYQIMNVETRKFLHIETNKRNHIDYVSFEKKINEYSTYFDIRLASTEFNSLTTKQQEINYHTPVYFHSWKQDKYLSLDLIGDMCLTEHPTEDGLFLIEPYNSDELEDGSIIRVKHIKSQNYMSFENQQSKVQMRSEARLIDTCFLNKVQIDNLRLTIFINDAHKILMKELVGEKLSYRNKKHIFKILVELVYYIYGDLFTISDFLSTKKTIQTRLSLLEQKLLADVGIINTLVYLCRKIMEEYQEQNEKNSTYEKKDNTEQQNIILYVMMCIGGICVENPQNARILIKELPFLYECIDKLSGVIELLFHLFKDSKELLLILQNTTHPIGKKEITSIELLFRSIQVLNFDVSSRVKILTLLQALTIVKGKEKIVSHEMSLLRAFQNHRFDNITLKFSTNDHHDLLVLTFEKETYEEIEEMLTVKRKYQKQLQLLKVQLSFICSLCYGRNLDHVSFVRQIIPEQMIYRYIKGNLQPEFKEIFMRILIDIYLNALDIESDRASPLILITNVSELKRQEKINGDESSLTSRLISQDEKHIEMNELSHSTHKHSLIIEKIQNLVLESTRKAISNQIIDCSFYMYIKALRKFFSLKILDPEEILNFKTLLTEYIFKFYKQSFVEQEKKNIVLEILKIIGDYAENQIEDISRRFVKKIKNQRNINLNNVVKQFTEFTKKLSFFDPVMIKQDLKFIPILVNESIKNSESDIFLGVSELFKTFKQRKTKLIQNLRKKIILDSEWSVGLYNKITKINHHLKSEIHDLQTLQMDPKEVASREQKLNHLIGQINYLFYENSNGKNEFSPLTQNIFRELKFFETIAQFINDNQRKIKEESKSKYDLFSTCFEFISYYLKDNELNFHRFRARYLDIKYVFEHKDRGQIKFLNQLVKMPVARKLMLDEIIDCILTSIRQNHEPNPYLILSLMNALSYQNIEKEKIERFVGIMLKSPELMEGIFKTTNKKNRYLFVWSYNPQNKNYHENWLIYSMIMVKFCLLLLENSSERALIAVEIQKYLPLSNVLELLSCPDLTAGMSIDNLCSTILKRHLIKLFQRIYMNELYKEEQQIQNLFSYIQNTFQNITYMKDDVMGAKENLIEDVLRSKTDQLGIISEIEVRGSSTIPKKQFQKNLNPTYINLVVFYPFIIKLLDTLINSNSYIDFEETLKKEGQMMMDNIFRKFKDYVQNKLKYGQFSKSGKQYKNSIVLCEEMFKRKIGFNLSIEEDEEQDFKEDIKVEERILLNRKLENTKKCYICASNQTEKRIYQFFLNFFHSQELKNNLIQAEKKTIIQFDIGQLEKLLKLITVLINRQPEDLEKFLQFFYIFLDGNFKTTVLLNIHTARETVALLLEKERNDLGQRNLCIYLQLSSTILSEKIHQDSEIVQKKEALQNTFKEEFTEKICKILQNEKKLYLGNKFEEQLNAYSENNSLSFQRISYNLTIQICLTWMRNFLSLVPPKNKIKHAVLFLDVVDLLQTYTDFIKEFNGKYLSQELLNKINLCLEIIFHSISGVTGKNPYTNYLIQSQIWNDFNLLLSLDDGWARNMDELHDTQEEIFNKAIRNQLRSSPRAYLTEIYGYYNESKKIYEDLIPDSYYPLLPMKGFYGETKMNVISILKEFKQFGTDVNQQLFTRIDLRIIDRNIVETYLKHENMFTKFEIPSVKTEIDYKKGEWKDVADNIRIQNGVDLTGLKMYIDASYGNGQIQTQYNNQRLEATSSKKIQSAFTTLLNFIRDFFLLFISCFLLLCRKKKKNKEVEKLQQTKMPIIISFFLKKMGRVQVEYDSNLYTVQYMVRPECAENKDINEKFINKINFVSMQLKLESIMSQASYFILYYDNEMSFYETFNKISVITFLTKNFQMINYINFSFIVAQNIILIVNSNSTQAYFIDTNPEQPFVWLQICNTITAGLIFFAYLMKDFPLLLKNINMRLKKRAQSYGSSYNSYNAVIKFGIKLSMVILDPRFAYHTLYSIIVGLVFYNKLFAALLLLDIFFQIPLLKNLLMSIWRPKIQLILAIISFILVQYFFSIFMFFNFKSQTLTHCDTLSSCFGFVFVTTYKAVGGFVGYLFEENGNKITNVDFFQIFQDVYVILVYQIFFALILAIIIDTFSLIRTEQTVRKDYLNSFCIVCNQDKTKFNSSNISFRAHIAINHNIWNYFYYYEYVYRKPAIRRTPYERHLYLSHHANWLPSNKSRDTIELEEMNMK